MRHNRHKHTLGVDPAHRGLMVKNLAIELIDHKSITTTYIRSKVLRTYVEKLVTLAKVDSVANRRLAYSKLNSKQAVKQLFTEVAPKFLTRPGGYIRINKLAEGRLGDNTKMSVISFVE